MDLTDWSGDSDFSEIKSTGISTQGDQMNVCVWSMAIVSAKDEWDEMNEDEKEWTNLIIIRTELYIKTFGIYEMPENVKNKPYLLTVLLKLDFFPHTTERAFFFFLSQPSDCPKLRNKPHNLWISFLVPRKNCHWGRNRHVSIKLPHWPIHLWH